MDSRLLYTDVQDRIQGAVRLTNNERNALNNKRKRKVRLPLNVRSWCSRYNNSRKTKILVQYVENLTDVQLAYNTGWEVIKNGIHPPGRPTELIPLFSFVGNGFPHEPSREILNAMQLLVSLRAKADKKGLSHWSKLSREDLPEEFNARVAGSRARTTTTAQADDPDATEAEDDEVAGAGIGAGEAAGAEVKAKEAEGMEVDGGEAEGLGVDGGEAEEEDEDMEDAEDEEPEETEEEKLEREEFKARVMVWMKAGIVRWGVTGMGELYVVRKEWQTDELPGDINGLDLDDVNDNEASVPHHFTYHEPPESELNVRRQTHGNPGVADNRASMARQSNAGQPRTTTTTIAGPSTLQPQSSRRRRAPQLSSARRSQPTQLSSARRSRQTPSSRRRNVQTSPPSPPSTRQTRSATRPRPASAPEPVAAVNSEDEGGEDEGGEDSQMDIDTEADDGQDGDDEDEDYMEED